jgi:CBS domain-containing protein
MQRIQKTIAEFVVNVDMVSVKPDEPVTAALAAMREHKSDSVLIVDADNKLIGIFTDRDFLNRVAAEKRDPSSTPIKDVMTPDPESLHATDCMTYAINRMAVRGYRNVPIIDADGHPISVLDVRIVMMHLLKVFVQIDKDDQSHPPAPDTENEWVDIGGG